MSVFVNVGNAVRVQKHAQPHVNLLRLSRARLQQPAALAVPLLLLSLLLVQHFDQPLIHSQRHS